MELPKRNSQNYYINDRELTPEEQKIAEELGFRAVEATAEQGKEVTRDVHEGREMTTVNPIIDDPRNTYREFERLKVIYQREQKERAYRATTTGAAFYVPQPLLINSASDRIMRKTRIKRMREERERANKA